MGRSRVSAAWVNLRLREESRPRQAAEKGRLRIAETRGKHDVYHNPETGFSQPVPRHREINERLAKKILKDLIKHG